MHRQLSVGRIITCISIGLIAGTFALCYSSYKYRYSTPLPELGKYLLEGEEYQIYIDRLQSEAIELTKEQERLFFSVLSKSTALPVSSLCHYIVYGHFDEEIAQERPEYLKIGYIFLDGRNKSFFQRIGLSLTLVCLNTFINQNNRHILILSNSYYCHNTYGIFAAASYYFQRNAGENLTELEVVALAILNKSYSASPIRNANEFKQVLIATYEYLVGIGLMNERLTDEEINAFVNTINSNAGNSL